MSAKTGRGWVQMQEYGLKTVQVRMCASMPEGGVCKLHRRRQKKNPPIVEKKKIPGKGNMRSGSVLRNTANKTTQPNNNTQWSCF